MNDLTQLSYVAYAFSLLYGLVAGIFTNFAQSLYKVNFKNKPIAKNIIQFFSVLVSAGLLFLCINYHNYGQFRLYLVVAFVISWYLEQKTLGKLIALLYSLVYNKTIEVSNKLKNSKVGKLIFK